MYSRGIRIEPRLDCWLSRGFSRPLEVSVRLVLGHLLLPFYISVDNLNCLFYVVSQTVLESLDSDTGAGSKRVVVSYCLNTYLCTGAKRELVSFDTLVSSWQ